MFTRGLREAFEADGRWPARVMLQAGVGGLAAAMTQVIRTRWAVQPGIIFVEPDEAPCLAGSAAASEPVTVESVASVMGRLDCTAPSWLAAATLAGSDVSYRRISDTVAEQGAARPAELGYPTTTSGGAGVAALLVRAGNRRRWLRIGAIAFGVPSIGGFSTYSLTFGIAGVTPPWPDSYLFVESGPVVNTVVALYMLPGAAAMMLIPLQPIAAIRKRWPAFHCVVGQLIAAGGLIYIVSRGTKADGRWMPGSCSTVP